MFYLLCSVAAELLVIVRQYFSADGDASRRATFWICKLIQQFSDLLPAAKGAFFIAGGVELLEEICQHHLSKHSVDMGGGYGSSWVFDAATAAKTSLTRT